MAQLNFWASVVLIGVAGGTAFMFVDRIAQTAYRASLFKYFAYRERKFGKTAKGVVIGVLTALYQVLAVVVVVLPCLWALVLIRKLWGEGIPLGDIKTVTLMSLLGGLTIGAIVRSKRR